MENELPTDKRYYIRTDRLPRNRYFQNRLEDIYPRMKRIIDRQYIRGRNASQTKACQRSMQEIKALIGRSVQSPAVYLVGSGEWSAIQDTLERLQVPEPECRAMNNTQTDRINIVIVGVQYPDDGQQFDEVLENKVLPTLAECSRGQLKSGGRQDRVILCVEHEKESPSKPEVDERIKKAGLAKFVTKEQVIFIHAKGHKSSPDASGMPLNMSTDLSDNATTDPARAPRRSLRRMCSIYENSSHSYEYGPHSPPKRLEMEHEATETDALLLSGSELMDVDRDLTVPLQHNTLSPPRMVTRSMGPTSNSRTRTLSGQLATDRALAISSEQTDLKPNRLSVSPTRATRHSSRSTCSKQHSHPISQPLEHNANEKTLLDAISYQLEKSHMHTLKTLEDFVKKVNKEMKDEASKSLKDVADSVTTLDKLLFEVAGVFYQSDTEEGMERRAAEKAERLSENLTVQLLRLQHVTACGRIYGKLHVHIETSEDEDTVKNSIHLVIEQNQYSLPYEVNTILQKPTWYDRTVLVCAS